MKQQIVQWLYSNLNRKTKMSDFIIYAEKKAFDEITFNGNYPNLHSIFTNHSTVFLNLSAQELQDNINSEGEIFYYLHAYAAAKVPEAHPDQFENVYDDGVNLVSTPRSIYFLDITKAEADQLQNSFGVIVQSCDHIDDNVLSSSFFRELAKDETIENGPLLGWKYLLNFDIPPSNALIISDSFLFSDTENVGGNPISVGKENIKWLLDKILPDSLNVVYHVTLISEDYNRAEAWRAQIAGSMNTEINNLRPYDINVEVVFMGSEHFHKRRLIMNYINASCDKGFSVFRVRDGKTVKGVNDIRFNRIFSANQNHLGDTEYNASTKALRVIKRECNGLAAHIVSGAAVYRGAILGGSNADKTLKNRLVNDV